MEKVKLSQEAINDIEKENTKSLIKNQITDWHKPDKVDVDRLVDFLYRNLVE